MFVDKYPHIKELNLRGGPETEEGRKYVEQNQDAVDYEFSKAMDDIRHRDMIGDNNKIHGLKHREQV